MGGLQCYACPTCWNEGKRNRYNDKRQAVYVRKDSKVFVRIGWLYKPCGHITLDKPSKAKKGALRRF